MDSPRFQYKVSWYEQSPGLSPIHQSHRYRNERQAREFIAWLRGQQPGVRVVLERRETRIGPWVQVDLGGAR